MLFRLIDMTTGKTDFEIRCRDLHIARTKDGQQYAMLFFSDRTPKIVMIDFTKHWVQID